MQRRDFLKWFLRFTGGYVAISASPLTRINTTLFGEANGACVNNPQLCGAQDCCTTQDNCGVGDATGHTCSQKDICNIDASNNCTNDECDEDSSDKCNGDSCTIDKSGQCTSDSCSADSSGACVSDNCVSDKSGGCVSDRCQSDKSGACQSDTCGSDSSGQCRNDQCISDKSGACKNDTCREDSSGACVSDSCAGDKSGSCQSDHCVSDKSGACLSDRCISDKSGICISDRCSEDSSGNCISDQCNTDASGECKSDSCESDSSAQCSVDSCGIDTRLCPADASCALDGACFTDGCLPDFCFDDGGCFVDIPPLVKGNPSGNKAKTYAFNRALKWLYRLSALALFLYMATGPGGAEAAVISVPAGDVASFVAAINTTNTTVEDDTINLGAGTYTLTAVNGLAGLPSVTGTVTINGSGTGTTIIQRGSGAPPFGIFHVADTGNLTLNRLIIQGGSSTLGIGGGILNEGALAILNCTISGNSSQDEEFGSAGGAGIGNMGTLTITSSSIYGNSSQADDTSAGSGAGIENIGGTVAITNATIFNNTITAGQAFGGGLSTVGGTVRVTNATISGNSATSTDTDETLALGGGIYGEAQVRNAIIALNTAADAPDCLWVESLGNNLFGNLTGSFVTLMLGDLTGAPGLGSFANNGAPGNGHLPLLAGSQAIDAGNVSECSTNPLLVTDQLGQPRTGPCDIGAVEFQADLISPAAAVPTLNEWGLILLIASMGTLLVYYLRRGRTA
jgi:hypothetical protein